VCAVYLAIVKFCRDDFDAEEVASYWMFELLCMQTYQSVFRMQQLIQRQFRNVASNAPGKQWPVGAAMRTGSERWKSAIYVNVLLCILACYVM
jgi:hypothetical protein